MKQSRLRVAVALLPGLLGACATASSAVAPPPSTLAARIDQVIDSPPLDQVQWGVLAVDPGTGRVLYERQADIKLIPASNMKLPVTAAALQRWGQGHRFETALLAAGPIDPRRGVLEGDLVLLPSGDPTLSERFWPGTDPLRAFSDSLRAAGVREVAGSLVVDASGWDSTTTVGSWMVEDLPGIATGGAFVLAEGRTTVRIEATQAGQPASVAWSPFGEDDFVVARIQTGPIASAMGALAGPGTSQVRSSYLPESRQMLLEGTALGAVATMTIGTRDPVRQAAAALARSLDADGITVRGGWRVAWNAGEPVSVCSTGAWSDCSAPVLARLSSPPLSEIVEVTLRTSHNWMAEQLVRALGSDTTAGWPTGLAAMRGYLVESVGADTLDFRLRDGSGLSAQNLLTPRTLVRLLDQASRTPWGATFRAALAEPGERGGTLENRLAGLEGRVFAKTGTLTNVAALSGYLVDAGGSTILFSIMTNGSGLPGSLVQAGIDQVVRILAEGR
jgi:D-alanyl-D-alanine carboxypeptidase/D-alanyl-D-alanine-endopeptidase (penicillin-binding protein 4)